MKLSIVAVVADSRGGGTGYTLSGPSRIRIVRSGRTSRPWCTSARRCGDGRRPFAGGHPRPSSRHRRHRDTRDRSLPWHRAGMRSVTLSKPTVTQIRAAGPARPIGQGRGVGRLIRLALRGEFSWIAPSAAVVGQPPAPAARRDFAVRPPGGTTALIGWYAGEVGGVGWDCP